MTISDLLTEYGAYYLNSGQNMQRIKSLLTQAAVTPSFATPIKTDETVYQLANSTLSGIVQGFQKTFTAKGALTVKPNEIKLYKMKIDFADTPDSLEDSWLGFLASEGIDRKDWPFVKWLIEAHILPKSKEEMELLAYYKGVYDAPTEGVANGAGDTMNGLKFLLQAGVDNGTVNRLVDGAGANPVGALAKATAFDQIELAVEYISEVYNTQAMSFFVAPEMQRAYLKDKRSNGFYQITDSGKINDSVDFTSHRVIGLPSMAGTTDMFITPKSNLLYVTKKLANANNIKLEESKREVVFMADWWEGFGFGINQAVWTNLTVTP